jgi:hypothetical protein
MTGAKSLMSRSCLHPRQAVVAAGGAGFDPRERQSAGQSRRECERLRAGLKGLDDGIIRCVRSRDEHAAGRSGERVVRRRCGGESGACPGLPLIAFLTGGVIGCRQVIACVWRSSPVDVGSGNRLEVNRCLVRGGYQCVDVAGKMWSERVQDVGVGLCARDAFSR